MVGDYSKAHGLLSQIKAIICGIIAAQTYIYIYINYILQTNNDFSMSSISVSILGDLNEMLVLYYGICKRITGWIEKYRVRQRMSDNKWKTVCVLLSHSCT